MHFQPLIHVMPHSGLEGKFSLHYCVAAALVDGAVDLSTFSDEKVANPDIRALIPKITMELDDRVREGTEFPAVITVETQAGRTHERLVPLAMGKPERWLSAEQLRSKFADCAGRDFAGGHVAHLFELAKALDGEAPATALLDALRDPSKEPRKFASKQGSSKKPVRADV
jgi:2-methylcitrate dehydratase PrpD